MKMPEIMNLLTAYLFLKGLKLSHQIMILLILWVTKIIFKEALCLISLSVKTLIK